MHPLKARQERFCQRFVEFGCAAAAALAAGYRLIRHPRIARRRSRAAMMTFGTGKMHSESTRYPQSMTTFVYRPSSRFRGKSKAWPQKMLTFVYFCIPITGNPQGFRYESTD